MQGGNQTELGRRITCTAHALSVSTALSSQMKGDSRKAVDSITGH